ncbi:3-keto-disaccharide hydrolase [Larkinella soli]|uniref:3-keto-disaccharide hydrolase n=1 Tax=Larkinella soli TaxID=1770527 RepID=UPI000FFC31C1|nr:DUF1080 domain-containing protein [Larkinella soli]
MLIFHSFLLLLSLFAGFAKPVSLFDGKTFRGWEGDTARTWKIENGALVGGSLEEKVPHNEFLTTRQAYGNFDLKLEFKLEGTEGFINAGVQFRSQRATDPAYEMVGYQADLGKGYWGCLYDESRRNKVLVHADSMMVQKILKPQQWNQYQVRAEGPRIRIWLNGKQTVDYSEPDASIPQTGLIGLQIHGGGKAKISYRNLTIDALP